MRRARTVRIPHNGADRWQMLRRRSGPRAGFGRQESARSRAARSAGAPCVGSTSSTGSWSSGRSASRACSRVTPRVAR
jgi:hypothetical protein